MENTLKYFQRRCKDLKMCLDTCRDKEGLEKVIVHNEKAVEALERKVPRKPKKVMSKPECFCRYYCPVCGRYFGNDKMRDNRFLFEESYCQGENCGQLIDWSENHKD